MCSGSGRSDLGHNGRVDTEADAVAARYERFAREEAPGRSELYAQWATWVTEDRALQQVLAGIPASRRQPPLVFAVMRLLGAADADRVEWTAWVLRHADAIVEECRGRLLQTNEPLRCAALLPALSRIQGPIALLEVGASAGLCLYPDRYSYRYRGRSGTVSLDPPGGVSAVVLECAVVGERMPPVTLPEIVWRAGIDLQPQDPRDPETERWLTGLVWPGETGREQRVRAALQIAREDPPTLVRGDGAEQLAGLVATAPAGATLVVQTPGLLIHLPRAGRAALIDTARAAGRWVTIDAPATHEAWTALPPPPAASALAEPAGAPPAPPFAVALDGEVLAWADPLGSWLEWRAREPAPRA